jgi:DNA-directed RNA polymerase specialized sigma24 family protein
MAMRYNGYSNEEIAKSLNISKGNVEARISRSIALIRNILKRDIAYYEKRRSI